MSWDRVANSALGCAGAVDDVQYRDFTGDGKPEAVVSAQCPAVTSTPPAVVLIFDGRSVAAPKSLQELGRDERFVQFDLTVGARTITVTGDGRSPQTANCCVDQTVTVTYRWYGDRFVRQSRKATRIPQNFNADETGFKTPSNNIWCGPLGSDNGVECNITRFDYPIGQCESGQPGNVWAVTTRGTVKQSEPNPCRGDRVMLRHPALAEYGTIVTIHSVSCKVEESGVTCTNLDGHGFSISRAAWRTF